MPMAGKGMLLTSMDIDAADEAEFNRWYDREHLEERVAIDGFLEARRYVAHDGNPKYLSLYSTETFEVLDSSGLPHRAREPDGVVEGQHRPLPEHDPRRSRASRSAAAPAAARRSASSGCVLPPAARTNCAPRCASSSIPHNSTASSPCT